VAVAIQAGADANVTVSAKILEGIRHGYGNELRVEVHNDGTTPLIGIFDMYSASLAAKHYGGMFVSGFGFAASYYGLPDIGFIAWPDMVGFVQRLRLAFPRQHLLVDIDDGYVDPEVACHVVEHLERIGASGVILEDQQRPRRCGHVAGKQILPIEQYLEKLNMVLQTRSELVIVARTDATEEREILRRAELLAATDADVLLVDGVKSGNGYERCAPSSEASRCSSTRLRAACHRGCH
jgi:2-methylisocitrate lyase-like PEP mutase family enzyme